MSNFIYQPSEDSDFLMHHGIKGQKWGVENGPPYPLNPSKDYTAAEKKANKNSSDKLEDQDLLTRKKVKGTLYDPQKGGFYNDWSDREIKASNLGLKALNVTRGNMFGYDPKKGISDLDREWFFFEDQTDGCGMIADLVNQGKSKKQILSYIDQAKKRNDDIAFELSNVYKLDQFIDACISIKKEEQNAKHSDIEEETNMKYIINENSDFLMHYGIKGQKWGERRFQNPDGSLTPEGKRRYDKYTKEFGEKTARRMMKELNRGVPDHQVFDREYRRRKSVLRNKVAPAGAGFLAGATAGKMVGKKIGKKISKTISPLPILVPTPVGLVPKPRILPIATGAVGAAVGGVLGSIQGYKLRSIPTGYSEYEMSPEGLNNFYEKMNILYYR